MGAFPREASTMERTRRGRRVTVITVVTAVLLPWGCGRTIEEQEPRELVEHRIEPCRKWCTPMLSPECGANPEDVLGRTVDGCIEDCAAAEPGGWSWGRQEDGTDACAEEWFVGADCIDTLTCEEQHRFFTKIPALSTDWPCKEETDATMHCFYSALEKEEGE
jgi:hypothetical protein